MSVFIESPLRRQSWAMSRPPATPGGDEAGRPSNPNAQQLTLGIIADHSYKSVLTLCETLLGAVPCRRWNEAASQNALWRQGHAYARPDQ